jgi:hypothetical protein
MKKNKILKYLNLILFASFIIQVISIINIQFFSSTLFLYHKKNGIVLMCLILLHFILNFNWIKTTYLKRRK